MPRDMGIATQWTPTHPNPAISRLKSSVARNGEYASVTKWPVLASSAARSIVWRAAPPELASKIINIRSG